LPSPSSPSTIIAAAAAAHDNCWRFPDVPDFSREEGPESVNAWMLLLERYFVTPGEPPNLNDENKIDYAFFKLKGKAALWQNAELLKYTTQGETYPTWANFKTKFINHWGELNIPT
jgi:hypothetical protein